MHFDKNVNVRVDLEGSRMSVDHHVIYELNLNNLCCDFFSDLYNMCHLGISPHGYSMDTSELDLLVDESPVNVHDCS